MKSYLLVFNGNQAERRKVTARLDLISAIPNWMAFFGNSICVVSDLSTNELSHLIQAELPDTQFILTELVNKNGWLPKSVWRFINHPEPADIETVA